MKIYAVGGSVRDALLGLPEAQIQDRDFVVVGATPQQMLDLGYRPVGADFPVFLHPETQDEYALARTERKTAPGYKGFQFHAAPDVTLEQDLARRDLTINAMAREVLPDGGQGELIDPFNGQRDLQKKILRHVSPAFIEDPLRVLRLARFAARYGDFTVAVETIVLAQDIAAAGELDALVPERVWQELSRGLMEGKPSRMFDILRQCDALVRILPEVEALDGVPQRADYHPEIDTLVHVMMVVDYAARQNFSLPIRFAALTHDLGKGTTPPDILPRHLGHEERSVKLLEKVCQRLKVPNDCRDLAVLTAREHGHVHQSQEFSAAALVRLLERSDALRKPQRFADMLLACLCDARGRKDFEDCPYPQQARLLEALRVVQTVDAGAIAAECENNAPLIRDRIHAARCAAIERAGVA
ncbi:MAG: multifunctional CCA addition/repair protein [Burkholderiaceae bacterium]|nr:MAG: multifunctional CCA addition/repair protein [Burkholderiaceae bacterium]